MVDEALKPGLRAALRRNEIGKASPYQLSFAAKDNSGASFGFMQGDLAAGQPEVHAAFRGCLSDAGLDAATIGNFERQLSVRLTSCPLADNERDQVNAALLAGSNHVDAMDETILANVYAGLDRCVAAATSAHRTIAPMAQLYMAMWINMTGPPTTLLNWLRGGTVTLERPVPQPGAVIDGPDMEAYLGATKYFVQNPRNFQHMKDAAAAGMDALRLIS